MWHLTCETDVQRTIEGAVKHLVSGRRFRVDGKLQSAGAASDRDPSIGKRSCRECKDCLTSAIRDCLHVTKLCDLI